MGRPRRPCGAVGIRARGGRCRFVVSSGPGSGALRERVGGDMPAGSPLGSLGRPSDIAFALLYVASDASRFVTGQILAVNGGESM